MWQGPTARSYTQAYTSVHRLSFRIRERKGLRTLKISEPHIAGPVVLIYDTLKPSAEPALDLLPPW